MITDRTQIEKMQVEQVTQSDLLEIETWREARGLRRDWPEGWLPSAGGFWVRGVAAGWLVRTDSSRALLEDFISNPDTDPALRGRALFAIEDRIAREARAGGYKFLIGMTMLESVRERVRVANYEVSSPNYSLHRKVL